MRKRNIIAAILMIAMTTSLFTGCKPSVPDDGTNTTEQGNTSATTEATTSEVQKAPVTLYANFDNEVLNDAPTTLPDDGFYYKAFTSIVDGWEGVFKWDTLFHSGNFTGDLLGVSWNTEKVTDTNSFVEKTKASYPELSETFELAKNKININMWMEFYKEYLYEDGDYVNDYFDTKDGHFNSEGLDTEVMPQIAALAEAWMEANFMGTPIPEDMTTEDFRTYIDTNEAYAYFASKGALPYKIGNDTTRESLQTSGVSDTRRFFATDKVFINMDFEYVNFMMDCTSDLYLQTEDGQTGYYPVHFVIVVKPEINTDGSWSFKLDYASFDQGVNQMDKFGTYSNPKACIGIKEKADL